MGVFSWLRRERVTVTSHHNLNSSPKTPEPQQKTKAGTLRTEEYKRDLAEFQARRCGTTNIEHQTTPDRKRCGRHSLPITCTGCSSDRDNTFSYEKNSALKYKKKQQRCFRSASPEDKADKLPNIQFLFQNQVFMPGNLHPQSYSDPPKVRHESDYGRSFRSPESERFQKQLDFQEDEDQPDAPPLFYKNNSLPFDVKNFLERSRSDDEEDLDDLKKDGDVVSEFNRSSQEPRNKDDSCEYKLFQEMSDLNQWAEEQLQKQSPSTSRIDDIKSESSICGVRLASASEIDLTKMEKNHTWTMGTWGVITVLIKKLSNVTVDDVKNKCNMEINILRKCRHPNIILLMGLFTDVKEKSVHIVCENFSNTLFGVLHVEGCILTAQKSVQYALDIANALVFLRMHGYLHTDLSSTTIIITNEDVAKLSDLSGCARVPKQKSKGTNKYTGYSSEPDYVNVMDARQSNNVDCEPLISQSSSEYYLMREAACKPYKVYLESEQYRWHSPELFEPDELGLVHPCSRSDVYSLCLILWESCNATLPWRALTYNKLKELYTLWKTGIKLPQDGTYPGGLLSLLQKGLSLNRKDRLDLTALQNSLKNIKSDLLYLEHIIIPARVSNKRSTFSSVAWTTSPTDSDCVSPKISQHTAVVHENRKRSDSSEGYCDKSTASPIYETIRKELGTFAVSEQCYITDDEGEDTVPLVRERKPMVEYISEQTEVSSACSTPIAKLRARIKDIGTPGQLHRSDSTEYCSIMSPRTFNFDINEENEELSAERPAAKLCRSFTPKSYKPLHIKLPDVNLESFKVVPKETKSEKSYSFDIQNYTLPTTPIARSNKLRRNAWLSGELGETRRSCEDLSRESTKTPIGEEPSPRSSESLEPINSSISSSMEKPHIENQCSRKEKTDHCSPESDIPGDNSTDSRRTPQPSGDHPSPESYDSVPKRSLTFFPKSPITNTTTTLKDKPKVDDEALSRVNVKPLVAIHERWIHEATKKTVPSMSLPEDNRSSIPALKPASHCVDTLQKSFHQVDTKRPNRFKVYRQRPSSPIDLWNNDHREHFYQTRDMIERTVNFGLRENSRRPRSITDTERSTSVENEVSKKATSVDQATETNSIEDFIKDLIRKEFHDLISELSDDTLNSSSNIKHENLLNKGVSNVLESLKLGEVSSEQTKLDSVHSFSRVKINGNNKPLLQITFTRSGESNLQVLDKCVNVTVCDTGAGGKEKANQFMDDSLTGDDCHMNSLKRCQAFNALQEAQSTEDMYIDDDFSTHMQENFGGRVKLIPLHGSLHELLCEKESDCCLIKVKQENGCDTIYFKCDNSDTESRDAIDSVHEINGQDTVVFKRSISLVEERIQRIFPKEKRGQKVTRDVGVRPKSEIFTKPISNASRKLSISSPSLATNEIDAVEVNLENAIYYQDSSSDECLICQVDYDDFELLERKIEEDLNNVHPMMPINCGCLEKISEENLSLINEDSDEKAPY